MSDNNKKSDTTQKQRPENPSSVAEKAPKAKSNGGFQGGQWLIGAMAFGAVVLSIWNYHQFDKRISDQGSSLALQEKQQQHDAGTWTTVKQTVHQLEQKLSEHAQKLQLNSNDIQSLSRDQTPTTYRINLQMANSGIQVAQWLLSYQKDTKSALSLMQSILERLDQGTMTGYVNIKQALESDIAALRAVEKDNKMTLLMQLEALSDQVKRLELTARLASSDNQDNTQLEDTEKEQGYMDHAWAQLKKLVKIRKTDQEIRPLLSSENRTIVEQNLQLMLQQAQWAVVHREQAVYQFSLEACLKWLATYFDSNKSANRMLKETITSLKQKNINPDLPTLNRSQEAVLQALSTLDSSAREQTQQQQTAAQMQQTKSPEETDT